MREIKFRAWNPHKKVMSYNFEEINVTGHDIVGEVGNGSIKATYQDSTSWKDAPLMQYIGLEDKNSEEIYEGDVMFCQGGNEHQGYREFSKKGVVEFVGAEFALAYESRGEKVYCNFGHLDKEDCEIMGNIYEHPHLLTKEEEK